MISIWVAARFRSSTGSFSFLIEGIVVPTIWQFKCSLDLLIATPGVDLGLLSSSYFVYFVYVRLIVQAVYMLTNEFPKT
jgi:hypothetical protein